MDFKPRFIALNECVDAIIDYRGKTPEKTNSGIPLITAKIVKGGIIENPTEFIAHEANSAWMRRGFPQIGDVVVTTEAPLGEVAQLKSANVALAQRIILLRGKSGILDNGYLKYFLLTEEGQHRLAVRATGTTVIGIKQSELRKVEIPIIPFKEQQEIASILSALDDKIALNRQTNATLEAIAQALFKSWFVDFDPVRAKMEGREPEGMDEATAALFPSELVESELGLIPKGCNVGILGDVCQNYREGVMPENIEPYFPYIGLEHMPRKSISLNEWGVSKGLESGKFRFLVGDILFGKLRPYFHKVGTAPIDGVCSTDILVIRPKISDWYGFSLGHLSSSALIDYAEKLSNGAKMPRTNWSDLSKYRVVLPDSKAAKILSDFFESIVYKIRANIIQSRTLAEIRDSLLPKLISGQLRIPDTEHQINEVLP